MQIIMPDNTEFKGDAAMATDPPQTTAVSPPTKGPFADMTLEGLTKQIQSSEFAASLLPDPRAELAVRMAAMFPGQKLVKARKAKGGAK